MRIRLFSHNRGNAINTLRRSIIEALGDEAEGRILLLRNEGSRFAPRQNDIVINYGSSNCPHVSDPSINFRVLNHAENIAVATNKRDFFRRMAAWNLEHGVGSDQAVPLTEWTVDRAVANRWLGENHTVYARDRLQGHSGEGIRVITPDEGEVGNAPLYTQGVTGARREYRIHVFNGEVILVQKKQRRAGWQENDNYSDTVRNLDGGWVFGISSANPSAAVHRAAINAIAACGLDFGAVDILAKGAQGRENEVYVLEVNTAPGQGGDTTTERYINAISAFVRGQDAYSPYNVNPDTDTASPAPAAPAAPVPAQEAPVQVMEAPQPAPVRQTRAASTGRQQAGVSASSTIPTSLTRCEEEGNYFADVEGYLVPVIVQHDTNGVFYIPGEEVPVTVTRLRSGLITFTA